MSSAQLTAGTVVSWINRINDYRRTQERVALLREDPGSPLALQCDVAVAALKGLAERMRREEQEERDRQTSALADKPRDLMQDGITLSRTNDLDDHGLEMFTDEDVAIDAAYEAAKARGDDTGGPRW